jgi:hypothetical protein
MQTTENILMVRPAAFGYNLETQETNAFQSSSTFSAKDIQARATTEFDGAVETLRRSGVSVFIFDDTPDAAKPDAVFPNNWISFHSDGTVVLYPMLAKSRRPERRMDIVESLRQDFEIGEIVDLSAYENSECFLEGTGSIVFDHANRIAYACLSPRTDADLLSAVCERLEYRPIPFLAAEAGGQAIYHTNVMMCIADRFAAVCLDCISDEQEREMVVDSLTEGGHEIVDISFGQMHNFAGNMLGLRTADGRNLLALSQRAFNDLTSGQIRTIENYCEMLPLAIDTIETVSGGSARCMMAEIFLIKK